MSLRPRVLAIYKRLLYLGRDYPDPKFRDKLHEAFMKQRSETDPRKIKQCIKKAEFVAKEIEALYSLKKYRAMKQRYYKDDS